MSSRHLGLFPRLLLAGLLATSTVMLGLPGANSPWLQGDEQIFIVGNPDVTGAGRGESAGERIVGIFLHVHDDLYQPLPIFTYALEWLAWGDWPLGARLIDLLLHGFNGVLVWLVLRRAATTLTAGRAPPGGGRGASAVVPLATDVVAWGFALLWTALPIHASTWAADMGRTHLLAATFGLLAAWLELRAIANGRVGLFVWALIALAVSMLSKPIVGWVGVFVAIEALSLGFRGTIRSWRVWIAGAICAGFAIATLVTTAQSGILEEASIGLFGDPISRSLLALWIYLRSIVVPLWLATWYLPDPATDWSNPRVWAALFFALLSLAHAFFAWRRGNRLVALGWAWFWCLLLPLIGVVGARESAATDRYVYQPTIGLALVLLGVFARRDARPQFRSLAAGLLVGACVLLAALASVVDLPLAVALRSTLQRAERVVRFNPGDPRALEMLAAAYDYSRNHVLPAVDQIAAPELPEAIATPRMPTLGEQELFTQRFIDLLFAAANLPDRAAYFPGPEDQARFLRRLSYRLLVNGRPEASLALAQQAAALTPNEPMSLTRLAQAYRALGRYADAADVYQALEEHPPLNAEARALRLTEFGDLLLNNLDRPALAAQKFQAALDTGVAPVEASIGLALCTVRAGEGVEGAAALERVLRARPESRDALRGLAEYHLRSHHFADALALYREMLRVDPTDYAALRGYHTTCAQLGRFNDAANAWYAALQLEPDSRPFRSFLVWALACYCDPRTETFADALLQEDPGNALACYALMMNAMNADDVCTAIRWGLRGLQGEPVAEANGTARALAMLRLRRERGELSCDAAVVEATILLEAGEPAEGTERLDSAGGPFSKRGAELAEKLRQDGVAGVLNDCSP